MTSIFIGTSSFYNRLWRGVFYPEDMASSEWFAYYCQHFNTFEINSSFYKSPTVRVLENWYKKAPEDFLYSVKAPKDITHIHRFRDPGDKLANFYNVCQNGLTDKLGCILFQLPPSYQYNHENLAAILDNLDTAFQNVVEFRNASWWNNDVFSAFRERGIAFCQPDYPNIPSETNKTTDTGCVRLHGNPRLFYSDYTETFLQELRSQIMAAGYRKVFIYFNNTASTSGILNALRLQEIIADRPGIR